MKKIMLIFCLLILSGCSGPGAKSVALDSIAGSWMIFVMSFFTMFLCEYVIQRKQQGFVKCFQHFIQDCRFGIYFFVGLLLFCVFCYYITESIELLLQGNSLDATVKILKYQRYQRTLDRFWSNGMFLLVVSSVPIALYTFLLRAGIQRIMKKKQILYYIPIVLSILFIVNMYVWYIYDSYEFLSREVTIVWGFPLYLLF